MIENIVDYLYQIPRFARTGGLEQTRERLRILGSPEKSFHYIHIAGTNGKGSTCAYMESALRHMGYKTGLFTSPHLVRINERIRINNEEITDEAFADAFYKVKALIDRQAAEGIPHPTFFEFIYLMAMCAFKEAGIEYGIIETGLGGRMDLTNAVEKPDLTLITSISLDHTAILGDSIDKIAAEKAGIIKKEVPIVFLDKEKAVTRVICEKAEQMGSARFPVQMQWTKNFSVKSGKIHFSCQSPYFEDEDMTLNTVGLYQVENACLARTGLEILRQEGKLSMPEADFVRSVREGMEDMVWPGRMEMVLDNVYVDGAHNDDGIRELVHSVEDVFEGQDIYLVFAVAEDKDYQEMIHHLSQIRKLKGVIITEINNGRRRDFHEVMDIFKKNWHGRIQGTYNVNEAIMTGQEWKGKDGILICTGSLYLVGHVKEILGGI